MVSLRYLLDTNVISEPLRPQSDAQVLALLKRHEGQISIASIVWNELLLRGYQFHQGRINLRLTGAVG